MEKLELKNKDIYQLEVNDSGDYIEFDLTDISLPVKAINLSENIVKIDKEYMEEILKIDQEYKDEEIEKIKKVADLELKKCYELRKTFDEFLGEGACQKIFGNKNNYGMFNELLEALEPHFDKMKINIKKAKEKLVNKYLPKKNDVM